MHLTKKNILSDLLFINIALLPILLITGPFLSDTVISINGLLFLYISLKQKNFYFFRIKLVQLLIICWFLFILSSLFSEYKLYSLKSSFLYFRFILFIGSMYLVRERLLELNYLKFIAFILPISIISIDVIFQSFFGFNLVGLTTWDPSRNSSFFGDEFISGSYIVRTLPISLLYMHWFIQKKNNDTLYYLLFLFLLISTIATFLSGERTAFFLILLFNAYFLFAFSKLKTFRLYFTIILILLISLILTLNKTSYNRMVKDTLNDTGLSFILKKIDSSENIKVEDKNFLKSISPHLSHYYSALLMYKDNKFFGIGPKNFRKLCHEEKYTINSFSCSMHPHNTWVQILSEAGIIPFFILIFLFIVVLKNFFQYLVINLKKKNLFDKNDKVIILGAFLITLWPLTPSGNFFNNWLSIVYFFPLGFYLILKEK
tara:strand:- start:254 stop:1543 length:1290 start_codon:yes stop_codon:yes gene_type:complete